MVVPSDELCKYVDSSSGKPVVVKNAPESVKEEARKINKTTLKYTGSEHYIIED